MKVCIIGIQGSGKTTQSKILADKLDVPFISTGKMVRDFAEGTSSKAQEVAADLAQGVLVDNEVTAGLVSDRLSKSDCQNGFVIDGFPRTIAQLKIYDPGYDLVIYLILTEEEATKRLISRGRADDTPEAIKNRLDWSRNETYQIVDYYKNLNKLVEVNGDQPIDQISQQVEQIVKGFR